MHELLEYIDKNIFWIIVLLCIFGGGIGGFFLELLDGRRKVKVLKTKVAALEETVERRDAEIERANGMIQALASGSPTATAGPLIADLTSANARMARILDQVQAADEALPQLDNGLRMRLDVELDHYHRDSAPKGITS